MIDARLLDLVRSPREAVQAIGRGELATTAVVGLLVVAAAILGGTVGMWRGGLQVPFAIVKAPLVFLLPVIVAAPAVHHIVGVGTSPRHAGRVLLVGATLTAVLAAAMAPLLWLADAWDMPYHERILTLAALLSGAAVFAHARLGLGVGGLLGTLAFVGLVGGQGAWVLRPWAVRPAGEVTFARPLEADIFDAVAETAGTTFVDDTRDWEPEPSALSPRTQGGPR